MLVYTYYIKMSMCCIAPKSMRTKRGATQPIHIFLSAFCAFSTHLPFAFYYPACFN